MTDWKSLKTSYGSAESVPQAIEDLCSPVPGVRAEAYSWLENRIVLQGALSESAPFAAREIIRLIRTGRIHDKTPAYDLLWEIGNGSSLPSDVVRFDGAVVRLDVISRTVVEDALDLYEADLLDQESALAEAAIQLVSAFRMRVHEAELVLEGALERTDAPQVRQRILTAVSDLHEWNEGTSDG